MYLLSGLGNPNIVFARRFGLTILAALLLIPCCYHGDRLLNRRQGQWPRCGDIRFWKSGRSLYGMWIQLYMKLWLSRNKTISSLGRWLWCNEFRAL